MRILSGEGVSEINVDGFANTGLHAPILPKKRIKRKKKEVKIGPFLVVIRFPLYVE
jgi:hypothetical protein